MPEKTKEYSRVVFPPEVIVEAEKAVTEALPTNDRESALSVMRVIQVSSDETWTHDSDEEFFADYRKPFVRVYFFKEFGHGKGRVEVRANDLGSSTAETTIKVRMPTRSDVERVVHIFESSADRHRRPAPPPRPPVKPIVRVFIGHGRDLQWRYLKDHLHEKQGLDVEAYEIGARAGLTIRDVLEAMLTQSSFALLVLTGEDEDATGNFHPRENVIHELGLFQGRLGWRRAIALLEEGAVEFSNIHGVNQIRFAKGRIQETYGEILATIRREFEDR